MFMLEEEKASGRQMMFYQRTQTEDLKDGGVGREILGSCHELLCETSTHTCTLMPYRYSIHVCVDCQHF